MPFIRLEPRHFVTVFRFFHLIRPLARLSGRLPEPLYLPLALLVFRQFKGIPALPVFIPGGKIPFLNLNIRLINRHNMIYAGIEQNPVMGNQNKPFLFAQIFSHLFSSPQIQMVRRFIDQQKFCVP